MSAGKSLLSEGGSGGSDGGGAHVDDVFRLLNGLSLRQYYSRFSDHGIQGADQMARLSEEEMCALVEDAGDREKLLGALEAAATVNKKKKVKRRVSFNLAPDHEITKCYFCKVPDPGMSCVVCKAAACPAHSYLRKESSCAVNCCMPFFFFEPASYLGPIDDTTCVCWRCDEGHAVWRVYHRLRSCLCAPCDWLCGGGGGAEPHAGAAMQLEEVPL